MASERAFGSARNNSKSILMKNERSHEHGCLNTTKSETLTVSVGGHLPRQCKEPDPLLSSGLHDGGPYGRRTSPVLTFNISLTGQQVL